MAGGTHRYLFVIITLVCVLCFIKSPYFDKLRPITCHDRNAYSYISTQPGTQHRTLDELNDPHTSPDDVELVDITRRVYIRKPPQRNATYDLKKPNVKDVSMGQAKIIDALFRGKKKGFFVECGAYNGETLSNTLFLERERGWEGLLVEADPFNYVQLLDRKRKAYTANVCVSTKPHPVKMLFNPSGSMGRLYSGLLDKRWSQAHRIHVHPLEAQCLPLYTLMIAMNRSAIDFFSLNVVGFEMDVLQTIPFDELDIKSIAVVFSYEGRYGKQKLQDFLQNKGYTQIAEVSDHEGLANDLLFAKNSYLTQFPYKPS